MTKRISFANLNLSTTSENKIWAKAKALVERNGFILDGEVSSFEEKFANYCNADFGIGVILNRKNQTILNIKYNQFDKIKFKDYFDNHKQYMNIIEFNDLLKVI